MLPVISLKLNNRQSDIWWGHAVAGVSYRFFPSICSLPNRHCCWIQVRSWDSYLYLSRSLVYQVPARCKTEKPFASFGMPFNLSDLSTASRCVDQASSTRFVTWLGTQQINSPIKAFRFPVLGRTWPAFSDTHASGVSLRGTRLLLNFMLPLRGAIAFDCIPELSGWLWAESGYQLKRTGHWVICTKFWVSWKIAMCRCLCG